MIPAAGNITSLRAIRTLKALRTLKVAANVPRLKIIIYSLAHSGSSIFYVFVIMLIIYYIFALIGVNLFGKYFPEKFGTIPKALYSLFVVMTLEGLASEYARPIREKLPGGELYFVVFSILTSFVLINVIVGIICQALDQVGEREKKKSDKAMIVAQLEGIDPIEVENYLRDELQNTIECINTLRETHAKFVRED